MSEHGTQTCLANSSRCCFCSNCWYSFSLTVGGDGEGTGATGEAGRCCLTICFIRDLGDDFLDVGGVVSLELPPDRGDSSPFSCSYCGREATYQNHSQQKEWGPICPLQKLGGANVKSGVGEPTEPRDALEFCVQQKKNKNRSRSPWQQLGKEIKLL